jgi:hypothetical protein
MEIVHAWRVLLIFIHSSIAVMRQAYGFTLYTNLLQTTEAQI